MSFSTKLGDDFLRVPKLNADGSNWVIYKDRLQWSANARGLLGHINGKKTKPVSPNTASGTPTAAEQKLIDEYKKALEEWEIFIRIRALETASEIWATLTNEFENRSRIVTVETSIKCAPCAKISLRWDSHPQTMTSLLSFLVPYHLPTILIFMGTITDEYDRHSAKSKKSTSSTEDAAFVAEGSKRGGKKPKFKGKCFNCGKPGHKKPDCWEEGGGKEGQNPRDRGKGKAKSENANTAEAKSKEPDGVWLAREVDEWEDPTDWLAECEAEPTAEIRPHLIMQLS